MADLISCASTQLTDANDSCESVRLRDRQDSCGRVWVRWGALARGSRLGCAVAGAVL